jgi:hypothetical protein
MRLSVHWLNPVLPASTRLEHIWKLLLTQETGDVHNRPEINEMFKIEHYSVAGSR